MDDDVLSIELCPDWSPSSIKLRLEASLKRCSYLQAAVGYWTVTDQFLRGLIAPALRHSDSFLCTDIHSPTDIDALADLVERGAHVRLMAKDIGGFTTGVSKDHGGLLHAKMLLFLCPDGSAELWVGSHNWTQRAIHGVNIEASVIMHLRHTSPIFHQAAHYLQRIKRECIVLETGKVADYKQLQQTRAVRSVRLVALSGPDAHALQGEDVTLFASLPSDVQKLNRNGSTVYLVVKDSDSFCEFTYRTRVKTSGEPSGIQFQPCRHSIHVPGRDEYWLTPRQPIQLLTRSSPVHFATLTVLAQDSEIQFEYPRTGVAWEEARDGSDSLLVRIDDEARTQLFGTREPILKLPVFFDTWDEEGIHLELAGGSTVPLVQSAVIRKNDEASPRKVRGQ